MTGVTLEPVPGAGRRSAKNVQNNLNTSHESPFVMQVSTQRRDGRALPKQSVLHSSGRRGRSTGPQVYKSTSLYAFAVGLRSYAKPFWRENGSDR